MASLQVIKPYLFARQPEVEILVLCLFSTVDLKHLNKTFSNHCTDQKKKDAPIPASDKSSLSRKVNTSL